MIVLPPSLRPSVSREVGHFFEKFLHRAPQSGELANYSQMLQLGAKDELVIDLICGSGEFFQMAIV